MNESVVYGAVNPLDYDAWDGYQSNRNRTFDFLYKNKIGNNIVISGDSHLNWASDLVWLDHANYSAQTGSGAIGVEFAGTAVSSPSPYGQNVTVNNANNISDWLTANNPELQWQEAYYRGYFELHFTDDEVTANYFGTPTIVNRNSYEIPIANFTVKSGANQLQRPVGGGIAETGSLKGGRITLSNITNDTSTGKWSVVSFPLEDL